MSKNDSIRKGTQLDIVMHSVGYLLEETPNRYILCRSYSNPKESIDQSVENVLIIPKSSVINVRELTEQKIKA